MSRKRYVHLDYDKVTELVKRECRSMAVFDERMGLVKNTFGNWRRGQKKPSPEDAARTCVVLKCTPQDIMLIQEEIEEVSLLIEKEKPTTPVQSDGDSELIAMASRLAALPEAQRQIIVDLLRQFEASTPAE